ncbi:hypothetical protein DMUE_2696, partial [Dictyocoela muelleri]
MIIVFNEENKSLIGKSKIWICDGTFKTAPNNFYQVFVIHCSVYNGFLPLIHILLPNKTEETYYYMLKEIKDLINEVSPTAVVIDFEIGIRNAFLKIFKNIKVKHCLFHFGQSIWRKIQNT